MEELYDVLGKARFGEDGGYVFDDSWGLWRGLQDDRVPRKNGGYEGVY